MFYFNANLSSLEPSAISIDESSDLFTCTSITIHGSMSMTNLYILYDTYKFIMTFNVHPFFNKKYIPKRWLRLELFDYIRALGHPLITVH